MAEGPRGGSRCEKRQRCPAGVAGSPQETFWEEHSGIFRQIAMDNGLFIDEILGKIYTQMIFHTSSYVKLPEGTCCILLVFMVPVIQIV